MENLARAAVAGEVDAPSAEQTKLNRKNETADAKANAVNEKEFEAPDNSNSIFLSWSLLRFQRCPEEFSRKGHGTPTRKTQRNFTDPGTHHMQSGESHLQGYNCKLLVDIDYQVIVAVRVCNQPQNVEQLDPMPQRIVATTGARPDLMWMGAGYSSEGSGLRRFLLRVLGKADAEWHLIAATNNLLKLFRYQLTQQLVLVAATG